MKPKHSLILVFALVAHTSFSQHALKLGVGYQLADEGSKTTQQFKAVIPSYFKFRSAHKYMEAGLSEVSILSENSKLNGRKSVIATVTPFYEFGRIIGSAEKKIRFKAGGRLLFGNQFARSTDLDSDNKSASFTTGLTFAVAPGLFYQVNDRLSMDLGVPFRLITISSRFYEQQGPNFPGVMKRNDGLEGELLPKVYQFKVGVIYRLGQ